MADNLHLTAIKWWGERPRLPNHVPSISSRDDGLPLATTTRSLDQAFRFLPPGFLVPAEIPWQIHPHRWIGVVIRRNATVLSCWWSSKRSCCCCKSCDWFRPIRYGGTNVSLSSAKIRPFLGRRSKKPTELPHRVTQSPPPLSLLRRM